MDAYPSGVFFSSSPRSTLGGIGGGPGLKKHGYNEHGKLK